MPPKVIRGSKTDVVLTVPHLDVLKVSVKPMRVYSDKEIQTDTIAELVCRKARCSAVINTSPTDPNSPYEFFSFDKGNKAEFFGAVEALAPQLVIDVHGMADIGGLFNNALNHNRRSFRDVREKKQIGTRPDVDIEFKRKSGMTTAKGIVANALAEELAKAGLVCDFEAVYPGGFVIERLANPLREVLAIEVNRATRTNEERLNLLVDALCNFIARFRGEEVEEVVDRRAYLDSEKLQEELHDQLRQMREESEQQQRLQRPAGRQSYVG